MQAPYSCSAFANVPNRLQTRATSDPSATPSLLPCHEYQSSDWTTVEVSALKPTALTGLRGPASLLRLQSDERLIALTRRGQHAAFETLFSRYQSRLLSFCRHMLGSREDAEDVLQEVFVAAFNAILADEREINVRPWLYRIARNRSLNHLRRASAIGVDSMDIHYAENGLSTGEKVLRRESFRQLIADVQQLPETQRTALLLREIDALSYEQIAIAMETTVPSVKSLLVRARISLAEAAEARRLSCEEVREELGEVAEGLMKMSAPVRRHVRDCERCRLFRKHLKDNNHALAAILPVGPLLLLKKFILTKLGSTASAGGAHVAGGATAGAAGAASAGGIGMGSIATAGAGALATKAAATLAAAALVTAGAVEADHVGAAHSHHHHSALLATIQRPSTPHELAAPVIVRSTPQPLSTVKGRPTKASLATAHARHLRKLAETTTTTATTTKTIAGAKTTVPTTPLVSDTPPKPATEPKPAAPPVTQVTTETTQLPASPQPETAAPPVPTTPTTPSAPTATTPPAPSPPPATNTEQSDTVSTPTPPLPPAQGEPAPGASTPAGTPQPITGGSPSRG
jgi:RNA polymerase sigma factor (sigma-70 family)